MALRNRFNDDDEDEVIEQPATLTSGRDTNRLKRKKRKGLQTKFDPQREARRLRAEPGRGNVEDIQELRNRPDPETDAFLGAAAREAGFEGDVGFGGKRRRRATNLDDGITFGDNPVTPGPERDESFGVNPRKNSTLSRQFGGTDFTARGARNKPPPSGKAALPGEMDGVRPEDIGGLGNREVERTDEFKGQTEPQRARFDERALTPSDERPSSDRAPGSGFDVENARVIASASPDSPLSRGKGVSNLRNRATGAGGTVSTIPAESFVNPAFTGINSGENIARQVRTDFRRDQRQAAIDSDREFRRNLRERQLQDDANLRLSGDMSLVELADAASRRRSARRTLQNRDTLASDQSIARSEAQQEASLEMLKERGRNARAGLKARTDLTTSERKAQREATEQGRERVRQSIEGTFTDPEGNVNQPLVEDTLGFIEASGLDPADMNQGEAQKMAQFNTLRRRLIDSSQNVSATHVENLAELEKAIGSIDKEVLQELGGFLKGIPVVNLLTGIPGHLMQKLDSTDIRIRNDKGQQVHQMNLHELTGGDPALRRAVLEILKGKVERGEERSVSSFL